MASVEEFRLQSANEPCPSKVLQLRYRNVKLLGAVREQAAMQGNWVQNGQEARNVEQFSLLQHNTGICDILMCHKSVTGKH